MKNTEELFSPETKRRIRSYLQVRNRIYGDVLEAEAMDQAMGDDDTRGEVSRFHRKILDQRLAAAAVKLGLPADFERSEDLVLWEDLDNFPYAPWTPCPMYGD